MQMFNLHPSEIVFVEYGMIVALEYSYCQALRAYETYTSIRVYETTSLESEILLQLYYSARFLKLLMTQDDFDQRETNCLGITCL